MSDDLTQIKGVGPARSDYLEEAGYHEYIQIGQADHEELAEAIDVPADTALEMVVQAQNLSEEQEASVEESEPEPDTISEELEEELQEHEESLEDSREAETYTIEEVEEAYEQAAPDGEDTDEERLKEGYQERYDESGDSEEEPELDVEPEPDDDRIRFTVTFENPYAYDTFFQALMEQKLDLLRANRKGQDALESSLALMRNSTPDKGVPLALTEAQLNDLHNCIRQKIIEYKGGNLIEHMDALQTVMDQIDTVRSEELF